jgi:hypothetical protein
MPPQLLYMVEEVHFGLGVFHPLAQEFVDDTQSIVIWAAKLWHPGHRQPNTYR